MAKKLKPKTLSEQIKTAWRRTWAINPVTKVVPSKKAYKRKPKHPKRGDE